MDRSLRLGKLNTCLLLAFALCGVTIAAVSASNPATAATGGITMGTAPSDEPELAPRFGNRTLKRGMVGDDVRILKGIVRSKSLLNRPLTSSFDNPTARAVKAFQKDARIRPNGVVNKKTSKTLVRSMKRTEASWYGPGLYGNGVACGGTLRRGTVGVAHKTLPCGSKVMVGYRGRYLMTKVIDRGPYIKGRALDLTYAGADALGFIDAGVANVRYAVVKRK
jgi:rare lipoprotein A (peptidoglycan hydrolase)